MKTLMINGKKHAIEIDDNTPLLWVLRDVLGYTGTKFGCGKGLCGSCSVHLDGKVIRSCITPVAAVNGMPITTIEGLSRDASHPVQRAWIETDVPQCGYCQSGQIMAAAALLQENPNPDDAEIEAKMTNLCRCGTYLRVRAAIRRAVELQGERS